MSRTRQPLIPIAWALLAGALQFASHAPIGAYPASWLGLAILAALWRRGTLLQNAITGLAFGAVDFGLGCGWLYTALIKYDGYDQSIVLAAALFNIGVQSSLVAVAGMAVARLRPTRPAMHYLALVPCAWILMELARAWTQFPWLAVGYGQVDSSLGHWLPVVGVYGVSGITMLLGGLLALTVESAAEKRWQPAAAAVVVLAGSQALGHVQWTRTDGDPVSVAIVQGNYSSKIKWLPGQLLPTINEYTAQTRDIIAKQRPQIVVWPETAIPAQYQRVEPQLQALSTELAAAKVDLLTGTLSRIGRGETAQNFNAVILLGSRFEEYRKARLVPLTEYLPGILPADFIEARHREGIAIFSHGDEAQPPLTVAGLPVRVSICFESLFGDFLRSGAGTVAFQVTVTNDDLFIETRMPYQHMEITRVRAIETGRDIVRAANSGFSALIAFDGEVRGKTRLQQREVFRTNVQPRAGKTPYTRWGDSMALGLGLLGVLAAALASRRKPAA
ncbi:MAG: apolipoprotein N-acyltransferase [Gammaproteobacteria bacterium]|nr:apolipoprotein N-acyltransferase [Gammaproteobacteria bacterium]